MLIPRPQRWLPLASASEIWSFMFQKNGGLRYDRKKALLHSCWMQFGRGFQRNLYHLSPVEAPGRYLEERDRDCGVFSYHALDTGELVGEELLSDPQAPTVEETAIAAILQRQLRRCLSLLPKPEQELLHAPLF